MADAAAVARVYIASWRSSYQGIIPASVLRDMDQVRETIYWRRVLAKGSGAVVACVGHSIVGFITFGPARDQRRASTQNAVRSLAAPTTDDARAMLNPCAEVFTVYLLDAHKHHGLGRRMMAAAAEQMLADGYSSACVWVLRDNPARGFYERLGGEFGADKTIIVSGAPLRVVSYVWSDLKDLEGIAARLALIPLPENLRWPEQQK